MTTPSQPLTRRGCVLGCAAWLAVMALPIGLFWFAIQGEARWQRGPGGLEVDRLFVVNEPNAAGLGYEAARLTASAGADVCVRTRVVYWLWRNVERADPNAEYSQCYAADAAGGYTLAGAVCAAP